MAIPSSKKELMDVLNLEFKKLMDELCTVPEKLVREKELEGDISVFDCVAYQIGWGNLLIGWYEAGKKNKMPVLPADGFKWNQLGDLAKHFYKTYEKESYKKLIAEFETVFKKVISIINENSDKQLYTIGVYNWTGDKWPLGRYINVNTSSPYKTARAKIRAWNKIRSLKNK